MYLARMSSNIQSVKRDFGDSSQMTNWILDSCATCHMTPYISDFVQVSLLEMDKFIKCLEENFVKAKNRGRANKNMI